MYKTVKSYIIWSNRYILIQTFTVDLHVNVICYLLSDFGPDAIYLQTGLTQLFIFSFLFVFPLCCMCFCYHLHLPFSV